MRFPETLEFAIGEWPGGGKRAFARAMTERGIRGSSYRTLVNYLSGATEPSPTWLATAAEELGVRPAWLSDGEAPMRSGDRTAASEDEAEGLDIWDLFSQCAPAEFDAKAHHVIVSSWWNAVTLILGSCPEREDPSREELEVVGRWAIAEAAHVGDLLRGEPIPISRRDFNLYFSLFFHAIAAAAPLPGKGTSRAELVRRLSSREENDA